MIDKKPFRVTNEAVLYTMGNPYASTKVQNICSDLLDSRKLIDKLIDKQEAEINKLLADKKKLYSWVDDANFKKNEYLARAEKAEALIKEMRRLITHVYKNVVSGSIAHKCEVILEKTKDYAE